MISKLIDAKEKIIPVVCARLAHNCHEVDLNVDYVNGTLTLVKNYKRDEKKEPESTLLAASHEILGMPDDEITALVVGRLNSTMKIAA